MERWMTRLEGDQDEWAGGALCPVLDLQQRTGGLGGAALAPTFFQQQLGN